MTIKTINLLKAIGLNNNTITVWIIFLPNKQTLIKSAEKVQALLLMQEHNKLYG